MNDATAIRIAALREAVETRLSGASAADIIARATEFVAFLERDNPDVLGLGPRVRTPAGSSAQADKAARPR